MLRRRRLLAAFLTAVAVAAGLHAVAAPPPATESVMVAARDLPAGAELGSGDLVTASFAPGTTPDDLAADPVGRILAAPLRRGEPVTDVRLVGPGLTSLLGPGQVAAPLRLPDLAVAGLVHAGDRIDVLATAPDAGSAKVVAAGVLVLAPTRAGQPSSPSGADGLLLLAVDETTGARLAAAAASHTLSVTLVPA